MTYIVVGSPRTLIPSVDRDATLTRVEERHAVWNRLVYVSMGSVDLRRVSVKGDNERTW